MDLLKKELRVREYIFGCAVIVAVLCFEIGNGLPQDGGEAGLRSLLLNEHNQELIDQLGTRYEVVYPFQISKNWGVQGLSTRLNTDNGTATHVQETTILIETFEYKLHFELELNIKLFAPTFIQLMLFSPIQPQKLPENCFYHAKVREYPEAKAAFQTCNGIRGVIYLEKKTFFIHPLHGDHAGKHPHLLYHYLPGEKFFCGNSEDLEEDEGENTASSLEKDGPQRNKFIEIALVMDQSLFQKFKSPPSDVLTAGVEIINYVDLAYRALNTSVSLVYLELWIEDQVQMERNITSTLERLKDYAVRRISRISVDATHFLTAATFYNKMNGHAYLDSICTKNAVGISQVKNIFEPHLSAFNLAHMIGHNLGMSHDHKDCECSKRTECIMGNNMPILGSTTFSSCSVKEYHSTLRKGYGACLYNMPSMRMSICGNSILEEPEQCDCGTAEECSKKNPCCDPMTCRLVKHAECSTGPCCKKCKLLSPDNLCRASKGECDIPEFCNGQDGQCPIDLFKKDGASCAGGLGYCHQGDCPVVNYQCQEIWGPDAGAANSVCFERLNVQGTPNGNCGTDVTGTGIKKCATENANCGFLQCQEGEKTPVTLDQPPIHFVIHKINAHGTVHECKARTYPMQHLKDGLVKDGTKCGYKKLCINQSCSSLKVTGKCPVDKLQRTCSNHGNCTNINTCFCDEGWKGSDCSVVDEEARGKQDSEYYDSVGEFRAKTTYNAAEMKLSPNLVVTVITASIVIGVGLVVILILIFFYKHA